MILMIEVQVSAQSADSFREQTNIEPGVEAWQLTRHGNLSPSLYTGAMEWSLPLYTYKDPDFELPISLQYHYDGFRPRESTGSIGLGWALDAGGVITREVRGLQDEFVSSDGTWDILGFYYVWRDSLNVSPEPFRMTLMREPVVLPTDRPSHLLRILQDDLTQDVPLFENASKRQSFDVSPDVFHFNFCGHSGEFQMTPGGGISVFSPNEPDGDFQVEIGEVVGPDGLTMTFKITMSDGYEYYFGTDAGSMEYSRISSYYLDDTGGSGRSAVSDEQTVTSWRLTSIVAPGGRSLQFNYEGEPDIEITISETYTPWTAYHTTAVAQQDTIPAQMEHRLSLNWTRLLKEVVLTDSGIQDTIISFGWRERSDGQNEHSAANYLPNSPVPEHIRRQAPSHVNRRLSSIKISNHDGDVVENIILRHSVIGESDGARRLVLSNVFSQCNGGWSFRYETAPEGDPLPAADAVSGMDLYGYWGGSGLYDLRDYLNGPDDYLAYQFGCDNISLPRQKTGALKRIVYPTAGWTDIKYEKNEVCKILDRNGTDMPSLCPFIKAVGGIRVSQLDDCNRDEEVITRTFEYEDGVLWNFPRIKTKCTYSKEYRDSHNTRSYRADIDAVFFSNAGHGPDARRDRLGYGKVIVHHPDGSRTEQIHNGWNDWPDVYPGPEVMEYAISDVYPLNEDERARLEHMFLPASQDWSLLRGAPHRIREYDADGNLRAEKEMVYSITSTFPRREVFGLFSFMALFDRVKMKPQLASEIETREGLTVRRDLVRDSHGKVVRETVTEVQSGRSAQTRYTYCDGLTSSDASICPGAVRDIITLSREQSESEMKVTGYIRFGYNRSDGSVKPSTMTVYQLDTPVSESAILSIPGTVPQYTTRVTRDSRLLPTRVDMPGGAYISYTWDTAGRNILSRTVNGTRDFTTYTWKDMVGLTSKAMPTGLSTSYLYDRYGRLSEERNSDGASVRRIEARLSSELPRRQSRIAEWKMLDSDGSRTIVDIDYYDWLGRLSQHLSQGETAPYPSIIQPVISDEMGRSDAVSYLSYACDDVARSILSMDEVDVDFGYRVDWKTELPEWYESEYGDGSRPFTQREYEPWSGGRVLSEQKPGAVYEQSGKRIHYQYGHNMAGDGVLRFTVSQPNLESTSVRCAGVWDAGQLHKSMRISEEGDTTVVFSDVAGRTLLSRSIGDGVNHDTYYIRDLRDSVVMVIQPEGSLRLSTGTVIPFGGTFAHDYCFGWVYDGLGRMVWSHVPGDGGTNYAYDIRGRLVYSDDANLRAAGKGRYYLYDTYDRLTEEGICVPCVDIDGIRVGLLNGATIQDMTGSRQDTHKLTYRETSSALSGGIPLDMQFEAVEGVVSSSDVRRDRCLTMLSFEKLREISGTVGGYTRRAYWYNAQGRLVQMLEKTSDGWTSRYSTRYDFVGNVVKYCEQHKDPSGRTHVLLTENTYDGRGRLTRCVRTLDGVELDPVDYSYDALGRANGKARDQIGASYKIRETLSRNMQGWITGIEVERPSGSVFSENITHRYDGFIEETQIGNVRNQYSYDHLGRLTGNSRWVNGVSTEVGTEKNISYDRNGNLTFLQRNLTGTADEIYFGYQGNRIVGGCINPQTEFLELMFSSDANGNLTENYYEGVSVSYNFLNMPSVASGITYTYLSDGTRISARKSDGSGVVARGSFSYAVSAGGSVALESIAHSEGRIYVGTPDGDVWDCWNVTDHLGNVRSVVNPDGSGVEFMLEQSDYLPFGMRLNQSSPLLSDLQRWHYAGKEYQKFGSVDLGMIDFGARYYSPFLGRWSSLDPLANKYLATSPYGYCGSNPLNFVDPDGEAWFVYEVGDDMYAGYWVDSSSIINADGTLPEGFYESVIVFTPGNKEFNPDSNNNLGSSYAIVFDCEGEISIYDACTYPSDITKYPTVPEGVYEAKKGDHNGSKSYPALKMFDVGKNLSCNTIELGFKNPAYSDGRTYARGIDIHKAGNYNATKPQRGKPISAGCVLIDVNRWDEFMGHFNSMSSSSKIKVILKR